MHRGRGAQGGTNHPQGGVQQVSKRTRWFVAIYDYDPTTMSPNPDACEEELRFNEGDVIKVCFLSDDTEISSKLLGPPVDRGRLHFFNFKGRV